MYFKGVNPIKTFLKSPVFAWHFFINSGIRVIYSKVMKKKLRTKYYAGKKVLSNENGNKILKELINAGNPFMFGRFGSNEINIVNNAAVTWRRSWVRLGLSWIPESVILSSITHEETTATWLPWVNGYGDFLIATRSSWGITEKIRVTNFWNVWIWTSTPWSKLSVVGLQRGTSLSDAGLDSTPIWAVCIAADGDIYVDTDGVCN